MGVGSQKGLKKEEDGEKTYSQEPFSKKKGGTGGEYLLSKGGSYGWRGRTADQQQNLLHRENDGRALKILKTQSVPSEDHWCYL